MQLDERTGFLILLAGTSVAIAGLIWLIVRIFPILRDLVVRGFKPFLIMSLGIAIASAPLVINRLMPEKINDKAVTRIIPAGPGADLEEVLALTGAKPSEYEILRNKKSFTVIKWANSDVSDDQVTLLEGMEKLRELDLNSAQITDRSLPLIASLPKLESLRLMGTKITDEGFRKHLLPLVQLKRLDLTNTSVKGTTSREWKAAQEDRMLVK